MQWRHRRMQPEPGLRMQLPPRRRTAERVRNQPAASPHRSAAIMIFIRIENPTKRIMAPAAPRPAMNPAVALSAKDSAVHRSSCSTTSVSGDCDYCEQCRPRTSHVDVQAGCDSLRICLCSSLVSLRVQSVDVACEDQCYDMYCPNVAKIMQAPQCLCLIGMSALTAKTMATIPPSTAFGG